MLGINYDRPRDRAARLADAVRIMKRAWAGDITLPGREGSVSAVPTATQRPHPPLFIGGQGDTILTLAATEANIVGFHGLSWTGSAVEPTHASLESFAERTAYVRAKANDRAEALELNVLVQIAAIGRPLEEQIRVGPPPGFMMKLSPELIRTSPLAVVGTQNEVVDKLLAIREQTGISYFTVFGPALDDMEPIVARLAGT